MTRLTPRLALLAAACLITAPVWAQQAAPAPAATPATFQTTLKDVGGADKGLAQITTTATGSTVLKVAVTGMTPGWHGIHFHEKGQCNAADKFASAGPHAAISDQEVHGTADRGPHAGDLPNIWVGADGTGRAEFFLMFIDQTKMADADGTALIVHAAQDDLKSQPAGNSGDRIACGVLAKQ